MTACPRDISTNFTFRQPIHMN